MCLALEQTLNDYGPDIFTPNSNTSDNKNFISTYTEEKLKQEQLIKSKLRFSLPRVLNVIPGIINTSMSELITGDRLQPKQIAELTYQMFSIRHAVLVQELTLDSPNSDWSTIKFLI
jgi:hypothetical protein